MVFFCQKDSFAKELRTRVVSCCAAKLQLPPAEDSGEARKPKPVTVQCWEVVCEDTVLFPEGGGQPDDRGLLIPVGCPVDTAVSQDLQGLSLHNGSTNGEAKAGQPQNGVSEELRAANVLRVLRKGKQALIYVDRPLPEGAEVRQQVEWARRRDNMLQHSGQHLISAVFTSLHGMATHSWASSSPGLHSTLTLSAPTISPDQLEQVEQQCNAWIERALPVSTAVHRLGDPALRGADGRGLPADMAGDEVRVVSIGELDHNMCCGTHISNTQQLGLVKLLHAQASPHKGCTQVIFCVGPRVNRMLAKHHGNMQSLQTLLHTNADGVVRNATAQHASNAQHAKWSKEALLSLAECEARLFMATQPRPPVWFHHRRYAGLDYLAQLVKACDDDTVLKVLSAGEDSAGVLLVQGPDCAAVGRMACEELGGKGGGKDRFTAKVTNLGKRHKLYARLQAGQSQPGPALT